MKYLRDARAFLWREVEIHVLRALLHLCKKLRRWGPEDIMNLLDLIKLICPRKKGEKGNYLEEHTTNTPPVKIFIWLYDKPV